MSYSRNFGMRSFENVVRDGRFRAPSAGTPIRIGAPVSLDPAAPGRLRLAASGAAPGPQCGIAVFEHIQNKSDALTTAYDAPYNTVPLGQYCQMMHGPGAKVWFKNTVDKVLYDGRIQAGGAMVTNGTANTAADLATIGIGDGLVPDGNGTWRRTDGSGGATTTTTGGPAWLVVEQVNPTAGVVEARLAF